VKRIIFRLIENWPEYQAIPNNTLRFLIKQKIRLMLIYFSGWLYINANQKMRLNQTKNLKNIKKGKSIILIASGPSSDAVMKSLIENSEQTKDKDLAVINWFFESEYSTSLIPNYYFISDPVFFDGEVTELDEYLCEHSEINLVIPFSRDKVGIPNRINYINNLMYYKKRKKLSPIKANLTPSSVVFHAFSYLHYLGYYPIYVCGLDVSYHRSITVSENNEIYLNKETLYGLRKNQSSAKKSNTVNLSKRQITPRNMSEVLINEAVMLRDLRYFRDIGIINIGNDSTNDALPRASLDIL
jgi:hypothetical protein